MSAARRLAALTVCAALAGCAGAPTSAPAPRTGSASEPAPRVAAADETTSNASGETLRTAPPPPVAGIQPPAPEPVAPAMPDAPRHTGAALFGRIRTAFATPACLEDRVVQRWERTYTRSPRRFAANLERVLPLMNLVADRVIAAGLPGEFVLLPIVESWYRIDARNASNAGLWQFSADTARGHGATVTDGYDGRLSPLDATEAAVDHLDALMQRFGDWRLAVMAYNAGEYRLAKAHAADDARPQPQTHRPRGLAMTTYEHLAKVMALRCLVLEPERFGVELPQGPFEPLRETALPDGATTLAQLAAASGVDADTLLALNRGFRDGRIVDAAPRRVLLPDAQAERLDATRTALAAGAATLPAPPPPREHRVRAGESLWTIARRYRLALPDLMRWNALDARSVLQPGQRLRLEP